MVLTGLSGSGKSSLAFDTIYAEGQRTIHGVSVFVCETVPGTDGEAGCGRAFEGLSPAISIDQKSTNRNPRSTVGTVTEIYDYLRLLYARVGIPHCPKCGKVIEKQTRGSDGGHADGTAGADEDPAAGAGRPGKKGRACESCSSNARQERLRPGA